jgi:outer membrane protein OmpA-like peptidoglycan-associated protein
MQKLTTILLAVTVLGASSGCMATRNFVRRDVKASSDTLSARMTTDEGELSETKDGVARVNDKVTQVNGKVSQLDATTNEHGQRLDSLKGEVQTADQKAGQAQTAADNAAGQVTTLDNKFENRNQFTVASTKAVLFGFDSAKLDSKFHNDLDDVAEFLSANPNAIAVLEGRTDSKGDKAYNIQLAERRIETVKRYLAVDKAVPVYRIHEISMGPDKPVAANDSREGREQNRAVTLTILVPASGSH